MKYILSLALILLSACSANSISHKSVDDASLALMECYNEYSLKKQRAYIECLQENYFSTEVDYSAKFHYITGNETKNSLSASDFWKDFMIEAKRSNAAANFFKKYKKNDLSITKITSSSEQLAKSVNYRDEQSIVYREIPIEIEFSNGSREKYLNVYGVVYFHIEKKRYYMHHWFND